MRTRVIGLGTLAGVALATAIGLPANAISASSADLSVLHAVPGVTVDVYVNDALTLDDFEPGTLTDPIDLPAGSYDVDVTAADAADNSAPLFSAAVDLAAGKSYTAVAHLSESGDPELTPYENNIATTAAGQGRLTVRHDAAAPAVDILAGGSAVVTDLSNPEEATLDLPVGTVSAAVALTGTTDPVIGPADVTISDGVLTIVYAWGSAADDNLDLAVQTVTVGHTAPGAVVSGTAGYAAQAQAASRTAWTVGGIAGAALLASGAFLLLRRRTARRDEV